MYPSISYSVDKTPSPLVSRNENIYSSFSFSALLEKWLLSKFTIATPNWFVMLNYLSLYRVYFRKTGSLFCFWNFWIQGWDRASAAVILFFSSLTISLVMKFWASGDRLRNPVFLKLIVLFFTCFIVYWVFVPLKGMLPVSIMKTITPRLHISQRTVYLP